MDKWSEKFSILDEIAYLICAGGVMLDQLVKVAELISLVIITCTLIFIAIQVKQGADNLRSESRQAQVNLDLALVSRLVEFPDIGRIFSQSKKPSFEDKTRLMFWMIGQLRAREHEWLQYKAGALDKESWESYRGVIFFVLGTPRSRDLWALSRAYFNPEFVNMVDEMMQDVPPIKFWEDIDKLA